MRDAEPVAPEDTSVDDLLQTVEEQLSAPSEHVDLCETLGKLAAKAVEPEDKKSIAHFRGIPLLLQTMDKHLAEAGVQEQGCAALKNLATDSDNECAIVKLDGIAAVVRSMNQHAEIEGVQQQALGALWNLGFNAEHKIQLVKESNVPNLEPCICHGLQLCGGLHALLRAMEQHVEVRAVQEQGFGVLRKICESKDRCISSLVAEIGGVAAVQRALGKHPMSPFLVEHGCWLWWHFTWLSTWDKAVIENMEAHGGGDTVLKALGKPFYKNPKPELTIHAAP